MRKQIHAIRMHSLKGRFLPGEYLYMWRTAGITSKSRIMAVFASGIVCLVLVTSALGGSYRDSAHGDAYYGVNRSAIEPKLGQYAIGNCAHCHQMHASLDGTEPEPRSGAVPHALFFNNFNSGRMQNLYVELDNFCFFCHSGGIGQQVINQDYSAVFGGATGGSGPQSIFEAFNQESYHNLYDVWNFARKNPAYLWFTDTSNPCRACHNPHLARRNWDGGNPGFPLLSAISKPSDHSRLWGETEWMSAYSSYEAPYARDLSREPAGIGDADGNRTPDYVAFCSDCHNPDNTIWSTTLNRNLKKINWSNTGEKRDKHGLFSRDGADYFREPYGAAAEFKSNFVLSCLDCHEPHGSSNIRLLRRRINGESLNGVVASTEVLGFACRPCHQDDLAAGAGTVQANGWEYVHHDAPGAPYVKKSCGNCHPSGGGGGFLSRPIACGNCHGHGMDDSWAGDQKTGRKTF